ncbi:MAG: sensor histidine kinase [Gammaproteobacteria bacterium]
MPLLIPLLYSIAAVTLFATVLHGGMAWLGVRRAVHGSFAALCLLAACTVFCIAHEFQIADPTSHIAWLNAVRGFACLTFPMYAVFVAVVTGQYRHRQWVLLPGWLLLLAVNFTQPLGISFADLRGVVPVDLPWGERIFAPVGSPSRWIYLQSALAITTCAQAFVLALRSARASRRGRARLLLAATGLCLAATLSDALVKLGVSDMIYLVEYTLLGFLAYMSLQLLRDVGSGARARDAARRLAREILQVEERERAALAQALHDGPLQKLALANMQLEAAQIREHPVPTSALGLLGRMDEELRDCQFRLSAIRMPQCPLSQALERLPGELTAASEGDPMLRVRWVQERVRQELDGLPIPCQDLVYGAVRELLVNAIRHAQATHIEARAWLEEGDIRFSVTDDGVGMRGRPAKSVGFGLNGVRRRVLALGGEINTLTNKDSQSGTRAEFNIPRQGCDRAEDNDDSDRVGR